jgi:hypothetical protein
MRPAPDAPATPHTRGTTAFCCTADAVVTARGGGGLVDRDGSARGGDVDDDSTLGVAGLVAVVGVGAEVPGSVEGGADGDDAVELGGGAGVDVDLALDGAEVDGAEVDGAEVDGAEVDGAGSTNDPVVSPGCAGVAGRCPRVTTASDTSAIATTAAAISNGASTVERWARPARARSTGPDSSGCT